MPAPDSKQRHACWQARDAYYACKQSRSANDDEPEKCEELLKHYEASCPPSWIKHFDKKVAYEAFKEKLEKHGAVYDDQTNQSIRKLRIKQHEKLRRRWRYMGCKRLNGNTLCK
eukprot:gene19510-21439_t